MTKRCVCLTSTPPVYQGPGARFGLPGPANNVCSALWPLCLFSPSLKRPPLRSQQHSSAATFGVTKPWGSAHPECSASGDRDNTQLHRSLSAAGKSPSLWQHTHTHTVVIKHLIVAGSEIRQAVSLTSGFSPPEDILKLNNMCQENKGATIPPFYLNPLNQAYIVLKGNNYLIDLQYFKGLVSQRNTSTKSVREIRCTRDKQQDEDTKGDCDLPRFSRRFQTVSYRSCGETKKIRVIEHPAYLFSSLGCRC